MAIKHSKLDKIGLMGSSITIKSNLYQKELKKTNIKIVLPSKTKIMILEKIITEIVAGDYSNSQKIIEIADNLKSHGAEGIILGCTELPLVFPKKYSLPVFDSLEILADKLLKNYYS